MRLRQDVAEPRLPRMNEVEQTFEQAMIDTLGPRFSIPGPPSQRNGARPRLGGRHGGHVLRVNAVLMDLIVRLTATLDEIWGTDVDRYDRYIGKTMEYVAAELDKLSPEERQAFVEHVEAMSASEAANPLASDAFRRFLSEFASGFGLTGA